LIISGKPLEVIEMVKKENKSVKEPADKRTILVSTKWHTGFTTDRCGRKIICKPNDIVKVTETEYKQLKHKFGIIRVDGGR